MTKIKEIFTSIQGEGPYVGYKQLFIRFCGCNLSCAYCDTEFNANNAKEYTTKELIDICNSNPDCHSVSLTGGEPLLNTDVINEIGLHSQLPVYLETNGTLYDNMKKVINNIKYVSADIKLPSATKLKPMWDLHDKFFKIASEKKLFAKVVFDDNSTHEEIEKITALCKKYNVELILQPMMNKKRITVNTDYIEHYYNECLKLYSRCRVIPQVHKFLNVE